MKTLYLAIIGCLFSAPLLAQKNVITDSSQLVAHVIDIYSREGYHFLEVFSSLEDKKELTLQVKCYSGKQLLIVAVYEKQLKAESLDGKLIIYKKGKNKTFTQPVLFNPFMFNSVIDAYYSLLQLKFPAEANTQNCYSEIVVNKNQPNIKELKFVVMVK
ncbi:MAG: hypothetical protein J0I09_01220 [Sphingobacteriia bacterium]|nr:hypothetical protein [Sphingobacteriia bacterium]